MQSSDVLQQLFPPCVVHANVKLGGPCSYPPGCNTVIDESCTCTVNMLKIDFEMLKGVLETRPRLIHEYVAHRSSDRGTNAARFAVAPLRAYEQRHADRLAVFHALKIITDMAERVHQLPIREMKNKIDSMIARLRAEGGKVSAAGALPESAYAAMRQIKGAVEVIDALFSLIPVALTQHLIADMNLVLPPTFSGFVKRCWLEKVKRVDIRDIVPLVLERLESGQQKRRALEAEGKPIPRNPFMSIEKGNSIFSDEICIWHKGNILRTESLALHEARCCMKGVFEEKRGGGAYFNGLGAVRQDRAFQQLCSEQYLPYLVEQRERDLCAICMERPANVKLFVRRSVTVPTGDRFVRIGPDDSKCCSCATAVTCEMCAAHAYWESSEHLDKSFALCPFCKGEWYLERVLVLIADDETSTDWDRVSDEATETALESARQQQKELQEEFLRRRREASARGPPRLHNEIGLGFLAPEIREAVLSRLRQAPGRVLDEPGLSSISSADAEETEEEEEPRVAGLWFLSPESRELNRHRQEHISDGPIIQVGTATVDGATNNAPEAEEGEQTQHFSNGFPRAGAGLREQILSDQHAWAREQFLSDPGPVGEDAMLREIRAMREAERRSARELEAEMTVREMSSPLDRGSVLVPSIRDRMAWERLMRQGRGEHPEVWEGFVHRERARNPERWADMEREARAFMEDMCRMWGFQRPSPPPPSDTPDDASSSSSSSISSSSSNSDARPPEASREERAQTSGERAEEIFMTVDPAASGGYETIYQTIPGTRLMRVTSRNTNDGPPRYLPVSLWYLIQQSGRFSASSLSPEENAHELRENPIMTGPSFEETPEEEDDDEIEDHHLDWMLLRNEVPPLVEPGAAEEPDEDSDEDPLDENIRTVAWCGRT